MSNPKSSVEWYTPPEIAEVIRGSSEDIIDLDPASCAKANEIIKATKYYTKEDDGLLRPWTNPDAPLGQHVFCNPPYARSPGVGAWIDKAIEETKKNPHLTVTMLLNSSTGEQWFQELWSYPICFVRRRIRFMDGDGVRQSSPRHSNVIVGICEELSVHNPIRLRRERKSIAWMQHYGSLGEVYIPDCFSL